jgi:hypothetical protein
MKIYTYLASYHQKYWIFGLIQQKNTHQFVYGFGMVEKINNGELLILKLMKMKFK